MKLNEKQLLQIEKHLDFKELTQVDLRNEVLDHMAINIESAMKNDNLEFANAFKIETQNWHSELESSSSAWMGWYWVGPKILMNKCDKEVKKMYLSSVIMTIGLLFFTYCIHKLFRIELFAADLKIGLGTLYLLIFIFVLTGFYKIKISRIQTTYSYLYKLNCIGFGFMFLAFNPFWNDGIIEALFNEDALFGAFFHAVLLSVGSHFLTFYRKHFGAKRLMLA